MEYFVSQSTSNIIYKFFDGDVSEISKDNLKDIYNDPNNYQDITKDNYKELLKIIKFKNDKIKDYRIILTEEVSGEESESESHTETES